MRVLRGDSNSYPGWVIGIIQENKPDICLLFPDVECLMEQENS